MRFVTNTSYLDNNLITKVARLLSNNLIEKRLKIFLEEL